MAKIDLSGFSMAELQALKQDAERELHRRGEGKTKHVQAQIEELVARVGMTPQELGHAGEEKKTSRKVPIKSQNPDNPSQAWSGRGSKPGWVKQALAAGKMLEELQI